jgi:NAD(P)-dependent dehydrogenase (short-subunit alcohol dehydrogenase family)
LTDFLGLTALVTGGTSGIGAATAQLLHERGGRVAIVGRRGPDGSSPYLEISADVTDRLAVRNAVAEVAKAFGGIDILVNSAGISAVGDVTANNETEWLHVLDVNVVGIVRMSAAALPHLQQSAGGAIVNIGSIAATVGVRQRALYSASKGAVSALTRAMAADHLEDGIRVNAVLPGTTDTPWVARLLERSDDPGSAAAELRARQPIGRLVTAEEVAHAVAYLASPLSGSTTGTLLTVDGGMGALHIPQ